MKYKVGDKVRIKTNLKAYESANCYVVKDMINMEGQEHIIERISPNHNYKIFTNDGCDYWWFSEEMLEPVDGKTFDEIKKMEEKKMPTKFTFYTEEGYRIDKSNNSKVETITTFVKINGFNNTYLGMATCDKVDYSERDGILNAIANAVLGGNFDREYEKFLADKKRKYDESCKCKICGRNYYEDEKTGKRTPFTPEDARKHEEWHEQNKKNKREKYLIRKEAKRRLAEAEREGKIEQTMKELYKK